MAQYTFLNEEDIQLLAKQYGLDNIQSFKVLSGGSENTNFFVKTAKGNYVLTICEQKTLQEAKFLTNLLEHLAAHQFETSKVIPTTKNESVILWKEKPIILKAHIDGQIIKKIPEHLMIYLGQELAKLHGIDAPEYLPKGINYGIEDFDEVKKYAPNSTFHQWLDAIKTQVQKYLDSDLPKSLIHSDVFYSNVIISEDHNRATIMDFEEAGYYYRIFDIGMTIVGLCCDEEVVDLHQVHHLLKGYQQIIELTDLEKEALQTFTVYAAAAMSFWRHRNFNYTHPTPDKKDHYLVLKHIADYVNKLPQKTFFPNC